MEVDDLTLLDRWIDGDVSAGNELFQRHFPIVYRFFEHKVDTEIDDLVQETFLACLRGREQFKRQSSFRTYLLAIARNTLFSHWRRTIGKQGNVAIDEISIASLSTSAGSRLVKGEDTAALLDALRALPMDQQVLLEMFYWEELEREELAEVFEVAEATIGSRLFRARKALQESLVARSAPVANDRDFDEWARRVRPA